MNNLRKTKIVCSIGPASDNLLPQLLKAGMNVARCNFSHGNHEEHKARMDAIKQASKDTGLSCAIMLDTKGPEIRTGLVGSVGNTAESGTAIFHTGDKVVVDSLGGPTLGARPSHPGHISLSWKEVAQKVKPGVKILIADGLFELEVLSSDGETVQCKANNDAELGSKKNVNIVGVHAGLPIMSEQDKADIAFGVEQNIDFVAASFLSFPREVLEIREYLLSLGSNAHIIAKIESREGLQNIDEIIKVADGVMVARGDLAQQIPLETIPLVQKEIISKCRRAGKPVITATQMLDSMIENPRPTRAELTDVANAVFDGSDAVMLSGETANGKYPCEAVETMAKIALIVESSPEFKKNMRRNAQEDDADVFVRSGAAGDIGENIARSAYHIATELGAKVIVTPTTTGTTARRVARYRPEQPILAVTSHHRARQTMLLDWGVFPYHVPEARTSNEMMLNAQRIATEKSMVQMSDTMVLAAGVPLGSAQPLNTVRVMIIGNILARASHGGCCSPAFNKVTGRIFQAETLDEANAIMRNRGGEVLVVPTLTKDYIPILRIVNAVIVEGVSELDAEFLTMVNPRLVWLAGVEKVHGGITALETGLPVTVDGQTLLVYEGVV
jgi:pyruvate kinase